MTKSCLPGAQPNITFSRKPSLITVLFWGLWPLASSIPLSGLRPHPLQTQDGLVCNLALPSWDQRPAVSVRGSQCHHQHHCPPHRHQGGVRFLQSRQPLAWLPASDRQCPVVSSAHASRPYLRKLSIKKSQQSELPGRGHWLSACRGLPQYPSPEGPLQPCPAGTGQTLKGGLPVSPSPNALKSLLRLPFPPGETSVRADATGALLAMLKWWGAPMPLKCTGPILGPSPRTLPWPVSTS